MKSTSSDNVAAIAVQCRQQAVGVIAGAYLEHLFHLCFHCFDKLLDVLLLMSITHVLIQKLTLYQTAQQSPFVVYGAIRYLATFA